jgi:phosphatidylglycerophosphate synthase
VSDDAAARPSLLRYQPVQDSVEVFFGRLLSKYLTPVFLALGLSANGVTAVWGLISLANSYVIFLALRGARWWSIAVFALYYLALVIDCSDGEVARARQTANPIGGKLLDGVWHKVTEFSLIAAFAASLVGTRWSSWAMTVGLVMMSGEAMYTYAYERRLLVIRVHAQSKESISGATADDKYRNGESWWGLSSAKKIKSLVGLIQYKSAYFMLALSFISPDALFAGVALLAVYKHVVWIRIINSTLHRSKTVGQE